MHPDFTSELAQLPISLPLFFAESCGYRGDAQFVALKWDEEADELWVADSDHARRGFSNAMTLLWRRSGGAEALARYRAELEAHGGTPWLLIDRTARTISLGNASEVWRMVHGQAR